MNERSILAIGVGAQDHRQGSPYAFLSLVVYGDYECPYTRRSLREAAEVRRVLGDELQFAFRNFPLTEIHPHALHAAEAAEAADAQGRFWEMHELLFQRQKALEDLDLAAYAAELGLDADRFAADMEGHAHLGRIEADLAGGLASGVRGTPTFFVEGLRHDAGYEAAVLLGALRQAGATR